MVQVRVVIAAIRAAEGDRVEVLARRPGLMVRRTAPCSAHARQLREVGVEIVKG
jgi:hypothetical protein